MTPAVKEPSRVRHARIAGAVLKPLSVVRNGHGLGKAALVILAMGASVLCGSAALFGQHPCLFWSMAVLATVWAQHAAAEEVHDGVHYRLLLDRACNDVLSGFYSSLIGVSFHDFRVAHLLHHSHFGTPADPDYEKYATRPEGWWGWCRYGIDNFCCGAVFRRLFTKPAGPAVARTRHIQHPLGTAAVQLTLWAITGFVVSPLWYPLCWVLPLVTLTYGMTQFRTMLEHWQDPAENDGRVGGLFNLRGVLQKNLFAGQFGYNYHGTHHRFPSIPNYNLPHFDPNFVEALDMRTSVETRSYKSRIVDLFQPKASSEVLDSGSVAERVATSGTLSFYWRTFLSDPGKIIRGVWDTLQETLRFLFWPRFSIGVSFVKRAWLLSRFIKAELKIPGGTTTLETIWLTYGAAAANCLSREWVEVGCFKGLSTARLSLLCELFDQHLHVYDTFEGLPGSDEVYEATDGGVAYHFKSGSYAGSQAEVLNNVTAQGFPNRVTLIKGDVQDSLRETPLRGGLRFAFLDVDLVDSYRACFQGLAPSIGRGTVIMIHEACYRPIRQLIEDRNFWENEVACAVPQITYVADTYAIRSCRNLAILRW